MATYLWNRFIQLNSILLEFILCIQCGGLQQFGGKLGFDCCGLGLRKWYSGWARFSWTGLGPNTVLNIFRFGHFRLCFHVLNLLIWDLGLVLLS